MILLQISSYFCLLNLIAMNMAAIRNTYLSPKGYDYPTPSVPFTYPPPMLTSTPFVETFPPTSSSTEPTTQPPKITTLPPMISSTDKNPFTDILPPPTTRPPTDHDHHHEPGMPFDFSYAVNDIDFGNDYFHKANSNGEVTHGEYQIALPDGRRQIVKYIADWKHGFNAEVNYEGEATHP